MSGRNEDVLTKARNSKNIDLIKGKVGRISESDQNDRLEVEAEDIQSGQKIKKEFDLVVLATGLVPNDPLFSIKRDELGFLRGDKKEGIIAAATSRRPMDVTTSVKDGTSAAMKSIKNYK